MSIEKSKLSNQTQQADKEELWRLMRRDDLAAVIGIAFQVPFHGEDGSGNWRYGLRPVGGSKNPDIAAEFESEMRQIVIESSSPLIDAGILTEGQVETLRGHPYETGPAAGDWWQYFFEIYQQANLSYLGHRALSL